MQIDKHRLISVTKVGESPHPKFKSFFDMGETKRGPFKSFPKVGEPFVISSRYTTSDVVEILDENTFMTLNSIYKYKIY
jgi:hypothetical protein